jgi:CDP-diacylglycerol--serine O-phosphatidyltransferase
MYFIQKGEFLTAIILAWIGGALDIADGKLARRYALSSEFGIQLDSFADFISFVVMPAFLLFYSLGFKSGFWLFISGAVFIYYIISGLRRLIEFNINSTEGEVERYFVGVPTPLGAILLWVLYLLHAYSIIKSPYLILPFVVIIAYLLNSKVKIPHP